MADVAFIPGCVALARLLLVEVEGPTAECPVILFCSQRRTYSSHSSSQTGRAGQGAGPATTELEAKLNKHKLNVVPQRGWNHFWESSERKGSTLHPTLEIAVPRQFREGWQVKARQGLSPLGGRTESFSVLCQSRPTWKLSGWSLCSLYTVQVGARAQGGRPSQLPVWLRLWPLRALRPLVFL